MKTTLYAKQKREYPEFVGKTFISTNSRFEKGRKQKLILIGCDYHIGVTAVLARDKKHNMICINGPLSPRYKDKKMTRQELRDYNKKFSLFLQFFKAGHYDVDLKRNILKEYGRGGYMAACAFSY